jgi:hypothetical protein
MYYFEDDFEGNDALRTYVKIEGENVGPIVQKLAKLAVDLPEICVWDNNILGMGWGTAVEGSIVGMAGYFGMDTNDFEKECDKIVAKSGADLGDDNIYFEWQTKPSDEQLTSLRSKIDGILKPYGNKYRVTNRK